MALIRDIRVIRGCPSPVRLRARGYWKFNGGYADITDRKQTGPKLNGFDPRYPRNPRLPFSGPSLGLGLLKILTADYADDTDRKQTDPKLNGFDPRYPGHPRLPFSGPSLSLASLNFDRGYTDDSDEEEARM